MNELMIDRITSAVSLVIVLLSTSTVVLALCFVIVIWNQFRIIQLMKNIQEDNHLKLRIEIGVIQDIFRSMKNEMTARFRTLVEEIKVIVRSTSL